MKKNAILGLPVLVLAMILAFVGCDNSSGGGSGIELQKVQFQNSKDGATYKLTITENAAKAAYTPETDDTYVMVITKDGTEPKTSVGTVVSFENDLFTLKPSNSGASNFTVKVNGTLITLITGSIAIQGSTTPIQGPISFTGGSDPNNPGGNPPGSTPTVTNVTVSPGTASIAKGGAQTFTASVTGTNNPAKTVTWAVTGGGSGTSISTGGVLAVGATESATSLTVRATSTVDATKSGTAAVTVSALTATVSTVAVTPATASVSKGGSQNFTATVAGTNSPAQTVTWTIVESGKNAGTTISTAGVLSVAAAETLSTLTVKATSTVDTTKSGNATVTVTSAAPTVTGVTVSSDTNGVVKGQSKDFTASVTGTNSPAQTVTWSIVDAGKHSETTIDNTGKLTVALAETLSAITVKATSTVDTTKSGTKTLNVFTPITLISVTSNGAAGASTTSKLTLTFDKVVNGLDASKIGFIYNSGISISTIVKGTLSGPSGTGPYTYTLPISGFSSSGTVDVGVAFPAGDGHIIYDNPKEGVPIHYLAFGFTWPNNGTVSFTQASLISAGASPAIFQGASMTGGNLELFYSSNGGTPWADPGVKIPDLGIGETPVVIPNAGGGEPMCFYYNDVDGFSDGVGIYISGGTAVNLALKIVRVDRD